MDPMAPNKPALPIPFKQGSKVEDSAGFQVATDILTVSPAVLSATPPNVTQWSSQHVQIWLADIFSGAKSLPKYLETFQDIGVNGVNLLMINESDLKRFGIVEPLHVSSFKAHIQVLIKHQRKVEEEAAASKEYNDMENQYQLKLRTNPNYTIPKRMNIWQPLDVFIFMRTAKDAENIHFALKKALAKKGRNGSDLILYGKSGISQIRSFLTEIEQVTDHDIQLLVELINSYNSRQEKFEKKIKDDTRRKVLQTSIPEFDRSLLVPKQILGSGSFGVVQLAIYEKKTVAHKELKFNSQIQLDAHYLNAKKAELSPKDFEEWKSKAESEKYNQNKAEKIEELIYEANMMNRARGSGVISIYYIDVSSSQPGMLFEYMCKKSIAEEIKQFEENKDDSLFHPNNPRNLVEKENGVGDPVLLQITRIARDVANALARLHHKGILHLDIAARNILLDAKKRPKIGDFGLSVMESDVIKYREWTKGKKAEFAGQNESDLRANFEIAFDELCALDSNARRTRLMYEHARPVRSMPHWIYEDAEFPLMDRKADVYSFGCLMYELAERKDPHHRLLDIDIMLHKASGPFNPIVSSTLHPKYVEIMTFCWQPYDSQPSMEDVAMKLGQLHSHLASERVTVTSSYTELKNIINNSFVNREYTSSIRDADAVPVSVNATAVYSSTASLKESLYNNPNADLVVEVPQAQPTNTLNDFRKSRKFDYPTITESKIRLVFPSSVELNDVERLIEYEDVGVSKDKLTSCLDCAFQLRDHTTLASYMECIRLENISIQVDMITVCLDYLAKLACDEHGTIDSEENWQDLCVRIMTIINMAIKSDIKLDPQHKSKILSHGLCTIADLLRGKTLTGFNSTQNIADDLCNATIIALQTCITDSGVAKNAAAAAISISSLDTIMSEKLYKQGAVGLLLDLIRQRALNDEAMVDCVQALGSFPTQCLCDPRPISDRDKSKFSVEVIAGQWGEMLGSVLSLLTCIFSKTMDGEDELDRNEEILVECILHILFTTCESAVYDEEQIEIFLYAITKEHIVTLVAIIREYPTHFKIQEGAIGLIKHILNTGKEVLTTEVYNKSRRVGDSSNYQDIPLGLSANARLSVVLEADSSLTLFLKAMENFQLNDEIAVGLGNFTSATANAVSRGMSISISKSKSKTISNTAKKSASIVRPASSNRNQPSNPIGNVNDQNDNNQWIRADDVFNWIYDEAMKIDEEGRLISAANLQKCVASILGIACNDSGEKDTALQQKCTLLKDNLEDSRYNELVLASFDHFSYDIQLIRLGCHAMFSTCRKHAKHLSLLWNKQIFSFLRKAIYEHDAWEVLDGVICAFIGLLEPFHQPQAVMHTSSNTSKKLEKSGATVNEDPRSEMVGYKVVTKLNLGDSKHHSLMKEIALRVSGILLRHECGSVISNFFKLITAVSYWKPELFHQWSSTFIDVSQSGEFYKQLVVNLAEKFLRGLIRDIAKPRDGNQRKPTNISQVEGFMEKEGTSLPLMGFVVLGIMYHRDAPDVVAGGFGIMATFVRLTYKSNTVVGDIDSHFSINALGKYVPDIFDMCTNVIASKIDHSILIRYTLWLLITFVTCVPPPHHDDFSSVCAASLSIHNAVEWAIAVIERYESYYTLQSLSIIFLLWMEEHHHLRNRPRATLLGLKSYVMKTRLKSLNTFISIENEGHDTSMMDIKVEDFGNLVINADKLLRILEQIAPAPKAGPTVNHVIWNGVMRPQKVNVTTLDVEEDPVTFKPFNVYVINVTWENRENDKEVAWKITKRFVKFRDLRQDLESEFSHICTLFGHIELKHKKLLQKLQEDPPEFLEARRVMLQHMFDLMLQSRFCSFNDVFLNFLEAPSHVKEIMKPIHLAPVAAISSLGIQSVTYDKLRGILLVASGHEKISFMGSKTKVRGALSVYSINGATGEGKAGETSLLKLDLIIIQNYNCGAISVAWEPRRRLVCVGLVTGPILFYHLSESNEMTYCAEIGNKWQLLSAIQLDPVADVIIAATSDRSMFAFDLNKGDVISQLATSSSSFISAAYDRREKIAFCGSAEGSVSCFDITVNPPSVVATFKDFGGVAGPITSMVFTEETRLLYFCCGQAIYIYRIYDKRRIGESCLWPPNLCLRSAITDLTVIRGGHYIVACTCDGGVAIFDMTSPQDSQHDGTAAPKVSFKLTDTELPRWDKIIHGDNAMLRDWLRGKGVNSEDELLRSELIKKIETVENRSSREVADAMLPIDATKDILFAWKYNSPVRSCAYVEENDVLIFGCLDGELRSVSLRLFFKPFDSRDTDLMRSRLESVSSSSSEIKGGSKAARGKRHQI